MWKICFKRFRFFFYFLKILYFLCCCSIIGTYYGVSHSYTQCINIFYFWPKNSSIFRREIVRKIHIVYHNSFSDCQIHVELPKNYMNDQIMERIRELGIIRTTKNIVTDWVHPEIAENSELNFGSILCSIAIQM